MSLFAESRSSWVWRPRIFGPVLFYDLLRTARRGRAVLFRAVYASLLLYTLVFVHLFWLARYGYGSFDGGFWSALIGSSMTIREAADFAAWFFGVFMIVQMLALLVLTPAYTSGAIAAEKERGTLTMMLATDLRSHEIVLGIFASRLANMGLFLLAGLPILSVMEFMGGVDPGLVLAGFIATALTILSLGALGLVNSVWSQKPRTALFRTYLWVILYLAVTSASAEIISILNWGAFPSSEEWTSPVTLDNVIDWVDAGNPLSAALHLARGLGPTTPLRALLPGVLLNYARFHLVITLVCLCLAVLELRNRTLNGGDARARKTALDGRRTTSRLRRAWVPHWIMSVWPSLWKEIIVDSTQRRGWLARLGLGLLIAAIFLVPIHLFEWFGGATTEALKEPLNFWMRATTALIGTLMLVQVAVRASGSVCGEQARQTLETLLLTPLNPGAILFAKWLASILSPRGPWLLLVLVWVLALFVGGMQVTAALWLIFAWLVYAAAMASLGLYCSVISRTTAWAILGVVIGAVFLWGACALLAINVSQGDDAYLLCPPRALSHLGYIPTDASGYIPNAGQPGLWTRRFSVLFVSSMLLWSGLAAGLWFLAALRFRLAIGRTRRDRIPRPAPGSSLAEWGPALAPVALVATTPGSTSVKRSERGAIATGMAVADARAQPTPHSVLPSRYPQPVQAIPRAAVARLLQVPGAMVRFAFRSAVMLLPLVLLLGWYTHLRFASQQRLAEAIAEADRLDPGWRLEELMQVRHHVAAKRDALPRINKAWRLIPPAWPELETEKLAKEDLLPDSPLDPHQAASLRADLDKASAALDEARLIKDCPDASFEPVWEPSGSRFWFQLRGLANAHSIAELLAYDVLLRVHRGDADGALCSCQALVNVERAMNHPAINSWELRTRSIARHLAVSRIERVLAQGTPSAPLLVELQDLLENDQRQPLVLLDARAQRAHTDRFWQGLSDGRIPAMRELPPRATLTRVFDGSLSDQRAACLKHFNELVEITKLPDHVALARINALPPNLTASNFMMWTTRNVTQHHWTSLAELRCAVAMLAVERYRLAHGNWPKSLNELVPAFLREVPADPFDGKPLRFRRLPDGVVIYAVGFDGTDDGGKLERGTSRLLAAPRAAAPSTGVDVGVRLWDASQRKQSRIPKPVTQPGTGQPRSPAAGKL
jgi:ABC-type transport system involved in multi-copper enzyme maturation permease subunit